MTTDRLLALSLMTLAAVVMVAGLWLGLTVLLSMREYVEGLR